MKVLVYGCGKTGKTVLKQLKKNPAIELITMDPREQPEALENGVIESIDIAKPLTPLVLEEVVGDWAPDLILLATSSRDLALGNAPGIDMLMDSLWTELATISEVPVIAVDRRTGATHGS